MSKICAIVGVGAGLGLSLAKRFGQSGYEIAMIARRSEALAQYEKTLAADEVRATGFRADVADDASLSDAFDQIQAKLSAPSVLIYNAAVMKEIDPLTISADEIVQDFKVSVVGALTAIQNVVPAMKAAGSGTILLTGGGLAFDAASPPQYLALAIGKVSIRKLSLTMANALEADNIHVATVTVGGTIQAGTHFDPDQIAETYWKLHAQEKSAWEREVVYQ